MKGRSKLQKELLDKLCTWQEPLINLLRQYPVACIAGAFDIPKKAVQHILDETVDPQLAYSLQATQFHAEHTRQLFSWKQARGPREVRAPLVAYIRRQNATVYADTLLASEIEHLETALDV